LAETGCAPAAGILRNYFRPPDDKRQRADYKREHWEQWEQSSKGSGLAGF